MNYVRISITGKKVFQLVLRYLYIQRESVCLCVYTCACTCLHTYVHVGGKRQKHSSFQINSPEKSAFVSSMGEKLTLVIKKTMIN